MDLDRETFILYPNMKESWTRTLQLQLLQESGISYHIYEENCSNGIKLRNFRGFGL